MMNVLVLQQTVKTKSRDRYIMEIANPKNVLNDAQHNDRTMNAQVFRKQLISYL